MKGSILQLIAVTMGAGTLTIPYIYSMTGLAFGTVLLNVGALLSYYSGMLIVSQFQILLYYRFNVENKQDTIVMKL
jgi:amino acid permease